MNKRLLAIVFLFYIFYGVHAQIPPKRELRGAWIATYANIDWPVKTQTPQQQRDAFINIINHHQQTGINVLYIQVRSQSDAMYQSAIDPWSADLTGTQGNAPSPFWDPMAFMIEECHKRGIEFHAWINPYRAVGNTANLPGFASSHVAKQHPDWMLTVGTVQIANPGMPVVRDYITSVIVDILQRYDIDGIHFDDYFYPSGTISDNDAFNADPRGFTVRADWRRDNINLFIKRVYDSIKSIKPWVKFGVSPTGIYRNSTNPANGTATSGLEHYTTYYADTKRWLQEGWVDYIMPQVYWYNGQPGANYGVIIPWWNSVASGRHIYIGLAGYKVGDPAQAAQWQVGSEIPNQVRMSRTYSNIYGQSVYNTTSLRNNKFGFRDSLRLFLYNKHALIPTMPWRDNVAPGSPSDLIVRRYTDSAVLTWTKPAATTNELDKAKRFVIYRSENAVIDLADPNNIMAITNTDTFAYKDAIVSGSTSYYYTVTALDRFNNESVSSNTVESNVNSLPLRLIDFSLARVDNKHAKVSWQTAQEFGVDKFEVSRSKDGVTYTTIGNVTAKNNTGTTENYSLIDDVSGLNGTIYYRLTIKNKDGSFQYSPVKTISITKDADWVRIFPSMLQRSMPLQVQVTSASQNKVYYNLFNGTGIKVAGGTLSNTRTISTRELTPGRYIIQVIQKDKVQNFQFIIQ